MNPDKEHFEKAHEYLMRNSCKKLPVDASPEVIKAYNILRQRAKEEVRKKGYEHKFIGNYMILANLSVNHPDWGKTPAEHEQVKAARQQGE